MSAAAASASSRLNGSGLAARCPWCREVREDSASLALHMARCDRRHAAPQGLGGPGGPQGAQRYRYVRVLDRARGTLRVVPVLLDKPFCCVVCRSPFASQAALRKHARTHAGLSVHAQQPFGQPFQEARELLPAPGVGHRGPRGAQQAFPTAQPPSLHVGHVGERPHVCDTCGKSFRTAGYLAVHARGHSRERPFACACGKAFVRRGNLSAHLVSHTRDRPHACARCGARFQFRTQLERHGPCAGQGGAGAVRLSPESCLRGDEGAAGAGNGQSAHPTALSIKAATDKAQPPRGRTYLPLFCTPLDVAGVAQAGRGRPAAAGSAGAARPLTALPAPAPSVGGAHGSTPVSCITLCDECGRGFSSPLSTQLHAIEAHGQAFAAHRDSGVEAERPEFIDIEAFAAMRTHRP